MSESKLHEFLDRMAETPSICRIRYGEDEPTHLPKKDYFWDRWELAWIESDKALIARREARIDEKIR